MRNTKKSNSEDFECTVKEYLKQGRQKLEKDLEGTREAINIIAKEKTRDFIMITDRGLNKEEVELLSSMIVASMFQSFCFGYGIGKIEGESKNRIYL